MNRKIPVLGILLILSTFALASCSASSSPSDVIEKYINAMVSKDDILTVNLSCVAWEENAKAEGAGFEGVEVSLKDASCSVIDESGDVATVSCSGKFVFQYAGGENEEINLDRRSYALVQESGEWKMCGYK